MAALEIVSTVDHIEIRPDGLAGFAPDVVLRDVTGMDGLPLPDGMRVSNTGKLRALELMPGDQIALGARQMDAYDGRHARIAAVVGDAVAFLASVPAGER